MFGNNGQHRTYFSLLVTSFTNLKILTPRSRVPLEKLIVVLLVRKSSASCRTPNVIAFHKRPTLVHILPHRSSDQDKLGLTEAAE
jgi:hypothetical protein